MTSEETALFQHVGYLEAENNSRFDIFHFPLHFVFLHYFNVRFITIVYIHSVNRAVISYNCIQHIWRG